MISYPEPTPTYQILTMIPTQMYTELIRTSDRKLHDIENELDDDMNPFDQTQITNFNTNECEEDEDEANTLMSSMSPLAGSFSFKNQN